MVSVVQGAIPLVSQVAAKMKELCKRKPLYSDYTNRILCAVLFMYPIRITDMFIREHALLLWIMEGGKYLRVHQGICYLYHEDGAFQVYHGVPPESTFGRVKEFLLILEGVFRTLPRETQRNDEVCAAIF